MLTVSVGHVEFDSAGDQAVDSGWATNVAEMIRLHRPAGVDASSRLESAPGHKDPVKVAAFVASARAASQATLTSTERSAS